MLDSVYKDLGLKKSGLVIGDMRQELGKDLMKVITNVVNEKIHLKSYYLLIVAKNFGKDIKTTVMCMTQRPPKMFGSICYLIDNQQGKATRLWTLPLDICTPDGLVEGGEVIEEIAESAKDMPLA